MRQKVISGILGHAKVSLAMDTFDHAAVEDFGQPLAVVAWSCYQVLPNPLHQLNRMLILKEMVSAVGIEPTTY